MQNSKSQAGTEVESITNVEVSTSSPNNAKPNVGCCTVNFYKRLKIITMIIEDTSKKVFIYPNAIKRKYENKQVTIVNLKDGTYQLEAINLDREFANEPAVSHLTERGVIRVSEFRMSKETLEAFILNAIDILNNEDVV